MKYLLIEYEKRYQRRHKSWDTFEWLDKKIPPNIDTGRTPFKICMKEEYKISEDPVVCYREYYLKDKVRFAKWKKGDKHAWWIL